MSSPTENPDAIVLLSTRASADAWWKSANDTIFQISARGAKPDDPEFVGAQLAMAKDMFTNTFTADWHDETAAKRAYEEHNAAVRAAIDPARLVDWQPGDGWEPICAALSLPVPERSVPAREHHRRLPGDDRPRHLTTPTTILRQSGAIIRPL